MQHCVGSGARFLALESWTVSDEPCLFCMVLLAYFLLLFSRMEKNKTGYILQKPWQCGIRRSAVLLMLKVILELCRIDHDQI